MKPTQESMERAAQIWCEEQHASKVMDSDFAMSIASALDEAKGVRYREEVLRTLNPAADYTFESRLTLAALGLAGEAGEVVDMIKKTLFHGKEFNEEYRQKLIKELGDVRWYLESFAWLLNVSMPEIEAGNIAKLKARFPEGFSHDAANAKRDEVTK